VGTVAVDMPKVDLAIARGTALPMKALPEPISRTAAKTKYMANISQGLSSTRIIVRATHAQVQCSAMKCKASANFNPFQISEQKTPILLKRCFFFVRFWLINVLSPLHTHSTFSI
jgi:hypothetical protein